MAWWAAVFALAVPAWGATPEAIGLNEAGVARTREGRYEEAAALLERALRLAPGDAVIGQNLARVRTALGHRLLVSGRTAQAGEQYRAALAFAPDEVPALLGLADVQLRERDARGATATLRRAAGLDTGNAEAYRRLGEAYYQQGELAAALAEWERALRIRPEDARLRDRMQRVQREARVQGGYRSRASQHFTAVFEGERREDVARELLQILERAYADVGYVLGGYPGQDVTVIFYSGVDFASATGVSPTARGFYHFLDGKIRIATRGLELDDPSLGSILYHEYAHALVHFLTRGNHPPRWMHEGLAVHLEPDRARAVRAEAVRLAAAGALPSLEASPYVLGSVAVEELIERHGVRGIQALLGRLGEGQRFSEAFQETFRTDLATFRREVADRLGRGF